MHHFRNHWPHILSAAAEGGQFLFPLFQTYPLVRLPILALTASHLRHMSPGVITHKVAQHYYQGQALSHYQIALDAPRELLGRSGVGSMLVCGFILNMLDMTLPEEEIWASAGDPARSWVFGRSENRLGWLTMHLGFQELLISLVGHLENTRGLIGPLRASAGGSQYIRSQADVTVSLTLPDHWRQAFGEGASSTNIYSPLLRCIADLRRCEPTQENTSIGLQLVTSMTPSFRTLLCLLDEKALWLIGYWLGLMSRFEGSWWFQARMRRDYTAIHMWLIQSKCTHRPGAEGRMWSQLMEDYRMAPTYDIRQNSDQLGEALVTRTSQSAWWGAVVSLLR
jgi:hypothetical protein